MEEGSNLEKTKKYGEIDDENSKENNSNPENQDNSYPQHLQSSILRKEKSFLDTKQPASNSPKFADEKGLALMEVTKISNCICRLS